jgi:hypothetical protein
MIDNAGRKTSGGGGTPGGSNTQIQYNNSGAFGGSANLTWNANLLGVIGAETITGTSSAVPLKVVGNRYTRYDIDGGLNDSNFEIYTGDGGGVYPGQNKLSSVFGNYDGSGVGCLPVWYLFSGDGTGTPTNYWVMKFCNLDTGSSDGLYQVYRQTDPLGNPGLGLNFYTYLGSSSNMANWFMGPGGGTCNVNGDVDNFSGTLTLQGSSSAYVTYLQIDTGPQTIVAYAPGGISLCPTGGNVYTSLCTLDDGTGTMYTGLDHHVGRDLYITGQLQNYRGVSVVSNGLSSVMKAVNLTAQGAAIAFTNLVSSMNTFMTCKISWTATITRAATTSSVLGGTNGFKIRYTNKNDSVVKTTALPVVSSIANTTATSIGGEVIIYAKEATAVDYSFDYTSVGATSMQYDLTIKLEWI